MKKILCLFIINVCLSFTVNAQNESYADGVVFNVDLKKGDIYVKTLQWMAETFVSSKQVIEYKDSAEGTIIGNASAKVAVFMGGQGLVAFTMKIEIKDGRYRVTVYGYRKGDDSKINEQWYTTGNAKKRVNAEVDKMLESLKEYLSKSKANNDNW
jgi:hypothetical protein